MIITAGVPVPTMGTAKNIGMFPLPVHFVVCPPPPPTPATVTGSCGSRALCRPPSTATSSTTTSRGEGGGVQLHVVCGAPLARDVAAVPPAVHTLTQLKDTSTTHFSLRPNSHSHPSPSFCPQQNRWQEHGTARKRVERLAGSDSPSSNLTLSPPAPSPSSMPQTPQGYLPHPTQNPFGNRNEYQYTFDAEDTSCTGGSCT